MFDKQDLFIMHLEIIRVFSAGSPAVSVAELSFKYLLISFDL